MKIGHIHVYDMNLITMTLKLDGNSEIEPHVCIKIGNLIH